MQPVALIVREQGGTSSIQPVFTDLLVTLAREAGLVVLPATADAMEPARS